MCVIREPGPSSGEPTDILREPHGLIDRSCFRRPGPRRLFSIKIAISTEMSPFSGGLGIVPGCRLRRPWSLAPLATYGLSQRLEEAAVCRPQLSFSSMRPWVMLG